VQLAELAQIAGWIASDTGRHELAARAYRLGISAAQEAADTTLVGNLMSSLAYQQTNTGRVTEGIQLADAALAEAGPDIPAKARALFLDRLAWAQTRAGEDGAAIRTLGDARDALLNDTGGEAPLWAYWVNHDELDVMDARVYTELRRPLKAVTLLSKVLDRYDPTHARELALYLSWLAVAYSDANEPEAAADAARRMLELSADLPSDRTAERTQIALRRLAEFGKTEKVGTLLAEYRTPTSFSTSMEVWPNTGGSRRHSSEPPP
jgi:tetratricopeptide (TPR) repeat protein